MKNLTRQVLKWFFVAILLLACCITIYLGAYVIGGGE